METVMPGSGRSHRRTVARGLAIAYITIVTVTSVAGTAWAAGGRSAGSAYLGDLIRAEGVCLDRATLPVSAAAMARCIGDLAPPDPRSVQEADLFRMFSDCLYIAEQQALDQSRPPTTDDYENYVNECMGL